MKTGTFRRERPRNVPAAVILHWHSPSVKKKSVPYAQEPPSTTLGSVPPLVTRQFYALLTDSEHLNGALL